MHHLFSILNLSTITCISMLMLFSVNSNSAPNTFELHSNSFNQQSPLRPIYTCDGQDISPALAWTGAPINTETFALILSDPDAPQGTFYHWVVYNIPKTVTTFSEGMNQLPSGALSGQNSFGKSGYNGPCPPKGIAHRYIFTVYALNTRLALPSGVDASTLINAMQKHILKSAEISTTYSH